MYLKTNFMLSGKVMYNALFTYFMLAKRPAFLTNRLGGAHAAR